MKKVKTQDLVDLALDWAVSEAINSIETLEEFRVAKDDRGVYYDWSPSTRWAQGGPFIERAITELIDEDTRWWASTRKHAAYGPTPLVASMRAMVGHIYGDEVEIPDDLLEAE